MTYPRTCPGCGLVREESDFSIDRYQPSGRKSRCKACCNRAAQTYHQDVRKPRREAALEAERLAEEKIRQREHKRRRRAVRKEAAEGRRRQREFLRSIGVPDLSPEEIAERALGSRAVMMPACRAKRRTEHWNGPLCEESHG
jgi:hypothetical protein